MRNVLAITTVLALPLVTSCGQMPPAEPPAQNVATPNTTVADREWVLVAIGDRVEPFGPQQRPPTLRLNSADSRAAGFAGCNQYFARYSLSGNRLNFESAGATKMYCASAAALESEFLALLPDVVTYQMNDSLLTLTTKSGKVARFRAGT